MSESERHAWNLVGEIYGRLLAEIDRRGGDLTMGMDRPRSVVFAWHRRVRGEVMVERYWFSWMELYYTKVSAEFLASKAMEAWHLERVSGAKILPYSQWTPEQKIRVAHECLMQAWKNPVECSTDNPGPYTLEQMIYLAEVFKESNPPKGDRMSTPPRLADDEKELREVVLSVRNMLVTGALLPGEQNRLLGVFDSLSAAREEIERLRVALSAACEEIERLRVALRSGG